MVTPTENNAGTDRHEELRRKVLEALRWAMDEVDVLSNKISGFAYPHGMFTGCRRQDQMENYDKACTARGALASAPERPPEGPTQDHMFTGKRGGLRIGHGLTISDLYKNLHDRLTYARPEVQFDIDALCQNFCCEVEKKLGVYPNVARASLARPVGVSEAAVEAAAQSIASKYENLDGLPIVIVVSEAIARPIARKALEAALPHLTAAYAVDAPGWQGMKSAPQDGTAYLIARVEGTGPTIGSFANGYHRLMSNSHKITGAGRWFWMPLPAPPIPAQEGAAPPTQK